MSSKTRIEWTAATWNVVTGCSKLSSGCRFCYAERDWVRLQHLPAYTGRSFTDVALHAERLQQPLRWRKPRRIFVNSMSDLFHEKVPDSFLDEVFAIMALCDVTERGHDFQILTKRPARMRAYMTDPGTLPRITRSIQHLWQREGSPGATAAPRWPLPNVWLGVSVENQTAADERIPDLLETPAHVRWISAEPLLGPVDLSRWIEPTLHCSACGAHYPLEDAVPSADNGFGADQCARCGAVNCMSTSWGDEAATSGPPDEIPLDQWDHGYRLHWCVAGGESGPHARAMHPDWVRGLRDQCRRASVAFFFKQWGEYRPICQGEADWYAPLYRSNRKARQSEDQRVLDDIWGKTCTVKRLVLHVNGPHRKDLTEAGAWAQKERPVLAFLVGKKYAGRTLDGIVHETYPITTENGP